MKMLHQLKWQLIILHKNSIISISLVVTIIYGIFLFFLNDLEAIDKILITLVLNDPSVIGYFFIALAVYMEIKYEILPAIFISPISLHYYIISKILALSIIGLGCSLGLVFFVKGLAFGILNYSIGAFGICLLSSLLGLMVLNYADDFLKFSLISVPLFILFINVPLLQYLGVIEIGFIKYLFPIQGCVDLIENAISGVPIHLPFAYLSVLFWIPIFYMSAFKLFNKRTVQR